MVPEQIFFAVRDDAIAEKPNTAAGKGMALNHEKYKDLPSQCFGNTDDFVVGVIEIK